MTLTRAKTPSELSKIGGLGDIPFPGLWSEHEVAKPRTKKAKKGAEAEDAKKPKDSSALPGPLNRHCVVRSKVEDPEILRKRQELQQSKSIHELSKIGNINQIPFPFKLPLPDIPLPSVTGLFSKKPTTRCSSRCTRTRASRPRPCPS
jgi:hypothetical protein